VESISGEGAQKRFCVAAAADRLISLYAPRRRRYRPPISRLKSPVKQAA